MPATDKEIQDAATMMFEHLDEMYPIVKTGKCRCVGDSPFLLVLRAVCRGRYPYSAQSLTACFSGWKM